MNVTLSGLYGFKDDLLEAIGRMRQDGFDSLELMMPVPDHELLDAVGHRPSPVGFITLVAGVIGMASGFIGAILAHEQMGIITGGKPIVAVPPFVIIAFEMTILLGGLATLAGLFMLAGLPRWKRSPHYHETVSEDHYVLIVQVPEDRADEAAGIIESTGGEVRR